jgi:hypothetical protein
MGLGIGVEWHTTTFAIQLCGANQAKGSHLQQVIEGFGCAGGVVAGNAAHKSEMGLHATVAFRQARRGETHG